MTYKIELEDDGQDVLTIYVKNNFITKTEPFQSTIWTGSYVCIADVKVGKLMPIHNPPFIYHGFYKTHKVININTL